MTVFLALAAILSLLFGLGTMVGAKSAIHEIAALVFFLIGIVSLIGISVINMLTDIKKALVAGSEKETPKAIRIG